MRVPLLSALLLLTVVSSAPAQMPVPSLHGIAELALAQVQPKRTAERRRHPLKSLETTTIQIGNRKLSAWVMDNESKRQEGMMHLAPDDLKPDDAMIFVFERAMPLAFWNANVQFDLDIAYLDATGTIIHVTILRMQDPTSVPSRGDAKYVLEMKRGAFQRLGVKRGLQIRIPPSVVAKE